MWGRDTDADGDLLSFFVPTMASTDARFARYLQDGAIHHGRLDGEQLHRLSAAPWRDGVETGAIDALGAVSLLTPCVPTKIVCVGLNYRDHIAESATVLPGATPPAEPCCSSSLRVPRSRRGNRSAIRPA